jgi:hypothetical protein
MRGRIYDPRLGRFLNPDPFVSPAKVGQARNPYTYVLNNPLRFVDPTGYEDMDISELMKSLTGSPTGSSGGYQGAYQYPNFTPDSGVCYGATSGSSAVYDPASGGMNTAPGNYYGNTGYTGYTSFTGVTFNTQDGLAPGSWGASNMVGQPNGGAPQGGGFQPNYGIPPKDTMGLLAGNSGAVLGTPKPDVPAGGYSMPQGWYERLVLHNPTRSGDYWSRVWNDFSTAHRVIPGMLAPPGLGLALGASGTIGQALRLPTFGTIGGSMYGGAVTIGGAVDVAGGSFSLTLSGGLAGAGAGFAEVGGWAAVGGATVVGVISCVGVGSVFEGALGATSLVTGAFR